MQNDIVTDVDKAIKILKTKDRTLFEETLTSSDQNGLFSIVLLYYSAKGQLTRKIQTKKVILSEHETEIFDKNKIRLENLKKEVEKSNLELLMKKYNEATIMGALVQSIRDNEANNLTYDKYLILKEKFMIWPKVGIKSEKILLTWKDFSNALHELEDWLTAKKEDYFPIIEKLIALFESKENITSSDFFNIMSEAPEKECYYIICNVLLTNPILRKEFLSSSMLTGPKLIEFDKNLYKVMDLLNEKTQDKVLKGLIILFKQQIQEQRPELAN